MQDAVGVDGEEGAGEDCGVVDVCGFVVERVGAWGVCEGGEVEEAVVFGCGGVLGGGVWCGEGGCG